MDYICYLTIVSILQQLAVRSLRVDRCSPDIEVRCEHVEQPDKAVPPKHRSKDASP